MGVIVGVEGPMNEIWRQRVKLLSRDTKGQKYSGGEEKGEGRRDNGGSEVETGEDLSDAPPPFCIHSVSPCPLLALGVCFCVQICPFRETTENKYGKTPH